MLIFILPAAFYLKLVKKEPLRSPQKVGVSKTCNVPYCISTTQGKSENTHGLEKWNKQDPQISKTQELKVGNTAAAEERVSDIHRSLVFQGANV